MVPIAVVAIALAFLAIEMIIQATESMRGKKDIYGFFMPDPPEELAAVPANFSRMVAALNDFGITPASNTYLHEGHTWAAVEKSGETEIGIDALARKAIGKVDQVELPQIGQAVRQGEKLFALRQGTRVAEFVAPVDGTVTSLNMAASENGKLDSSDWICKVRPDNLSANLKVMKIAEEAIAWIHDELFRLQEMVVMQMPRLQTVGATMQDGVLALDNLLETLDDEAWNMFEDRFLKQS